MAEPVEIFLNLFFKSYILTNGCSLGPGEEIILFFMPKILTSGSLKYLEIPLVVLYRTVLYKTILRVSNLRHFNRTHKYSPRKESVQYKYQYSSPIKHFKFEKQPFSQNLHISFTIVPKFNLNNY